MKFELEFLDEFIKKECRKSNKLSHHAPIPDYSKKRQLIEREVARIKKSFVTHLFEVEDESRFELFIQHHQAHIIRLADKVATTIDKEETIYLTEISTRSTRLSLCTVLLQSFETLLTHIETRYSKYFDQDQKIPDTYAYISAKEFKDKLDLLAGIFHDNKLDKRLGELILYPIQQFVAKEEIRGITFRRLIYMKYLVKELIRLSKSGDRKSYTQAVYEHLFYLNFNSYHVLHYVTAKIRKEIELLPSITSQLEHLSHTLKELSQAQVKPDFALKPKRSSLKTILTEWLEVEIHFIEKKRQLTLMIPPGGQRLENINDFKVKTVLSVSQLAYSIRMLKDTGIITNDNKAELIRFFSKFFSSAHNENISQESFRSKFFSYERSTVVHIQGVLTKLMAHTKKE
ncbi:MAG: hypothetical protein WAZ98_08795 [Cyclobacteriaceae bacterium]